MDMHGQSPARNYPWAVSLKDSAASGRDGAARYRYALHREKSMWGGVRRAGMGVLVAMAKRVAAVER
ncbi:hypothetical protein [Spirillospora sp. CA-294931]|uniref:hypothetical protein n=1 Tax=Spirillospora sp. CA-294931 TaxID=3240042 RepID=UPI003D89B4A2